jgi:hypothetical protein
VTQELYPHLPAKIHTKIKALEEVNEEVTGGASVLVHPCTRELGTAAQNREHKQANAHYHEEKQTLRDFCCNGNRTTPGGALDRTSGAKKLNRRADRHRSNSRDKQNE